MSKAEEYILLDIATNKKYLMTFMRIYTEINEPLQVLLKKIRSIWLKTLNAQQLSVRYAPLLN